MALILSTSRDLPPLTPDETWLVYNGLDCCVTQQVYDALHAQLSADTHLARLRRKTYEFEMNCQVLALEMMRRGLRVDLLERQKVSTRLEANVNRLEHILSRYAMAIQRKPLNPNSHTQLKELLYGWLNLPKQYKIEKGERKLTTERKALEKLLVYFHGAPVIHALLAYADEVNLQRVVDRPLAGGTRFLYSMNVGATETGRWSSSKHPIGYGSNAQNITDYARRMFIPDPGYIFVNFDLVTAESLCVAYLSGDENYLEACNSGDLHTWACPFMWPGLDWTGDVVKDRPLADSSFYRHFSYRDIMKRGGHASNYYGKPYTVANELRVPLELMKDFQNFYFTKFPGIANWHVETKAKLQLDKYLITPLGRVRHFFGRLDTDETLREGLAYEPQSTIVDTINRGALKVFRRFPQFQFLAQGHDSFLGQIRDSERHLIPIIAAEIPITTEVRGRPMTIPVEASIGWNWGKMDLRQTNPDGTPNLNYNPYGLRKWGKSGPELQVLDNSVPGVHGGDREPVTVP